MGVLVTFWEKLSRSVSKDSFDESLIFSGLDARTEGSRSPSSAEGPVLFEDPIVDYDMVRGARDFPGTAKEAQDMAESFERAKPEQPEMGQEAVDAEAPDPSPDSETSGPDIEGSSGFGDLSLDIFASDEMDDDDNVDMPDDLADVNIEALLLECQSVGERLFGSVRKRSKE